MEKSILKATKGMDYLPHVNGICSLYPESNQPLLLCELDMLSGFSLSVSSLYAGNWHILYRQLAKLACFLLLLLATNAVSEKSFSAMAHLKTCLHANIGQLR